MSSSAAIPKDAVQVGDGAASELPRTRSRTTLKKPGKNMNGPLYMQADGKVVLVRRIKRKNESPVRQFTRWFVENQTGLCFNLLALLFLTHSFFPRLREHTAKFYTLSYYNPKTGLYDIGGDDAYLVFFFFTLITGLRASTMEYILAPFAQKKGIRKKKEIARFSEQAWLLIYTTVFWSMGMYLYCTSPYFWNLKNLWAGWPDREIGGLMKGYILAQLGFWFQQILVINIEERRKDHWQMLTHHVVTIALMTASYQYRHTRVANLILVLMDVGDLVLSIAKCLKYLGHSTLCDIAFGVFMLCWFVARHVFFPMVCWSVWAQTPEVIAYGCYTGPAGDQTGPVPPPAGSLTYLIEPFRNARGMVCYNGTVKWLFLATLLFLELIILVWFVMIVQVAVRVLKGAGADDSRSDDEADEDEEDEDEDEYVYEEAQPLEEEVGVEAIDLKGWERRAGVKRASPAATGVSLPGHSDRKELLGRIGCEKQVD